MIGSYLKRVFSSFREQMTTIDDAAGEAFDKGGKLMGLGYPCGTFIFIFWLEDKDMSFYYRQLLLP